MEKIKKIILILTILMFAIIFMIIILNGGQNNDESPSNDFIANNETEEKAFSEIKDYETYYRVKSILNKYIVYVKEINGDEKVETGKLNMTEDEIKNTLEKQGINAINKMLDEQYIEKMHISDENIKTKQKQYQKNDGNYNLNIEDMVKYELDTNISIILTDAKLNNQEFNTIIKLDMQNNTYSLFLDDFIEEYKYNKNMSKKDVNINSKSIDSNSFNSKIKVNATETNIVSDIFVEYKGKMINDTMTAYKLLNDEYKQKKYGSYEKFESYVKNNEEKILTSQIDKYQITENNGIKNYICIDKSGRYYIFEEKDILHYEVMLDTYTVDLPEFLEQYNKSTDNIKCGMNIQKIFEAINNEDIDFVYEKMDNTFKQNNFSNKESFKSYAEKYLQNKEIEYKECEENGNIYIYTIELTDQNSNVDSKTIVMKLLDGTEFVFSFSI